MLLVTAGCYKPKIERGALTRTIRAVEGVAVTVAPNGVSGWIIGVENRRDDQVLVLWDESSFVADDGISRGRLVRGQTIRIDLGRTQPASPVAPGARIIEFVVPEAIADYVPPRPANDQKSVQINTAQPSVSRGVGRMIIMFETRAGKELWEERLFLDAKTTEDDVRAIMDATRAAERVMPTGEPAVPTTAPTPTQQEK